MVLSHPHHDHAAGLQAVLENLPVEELWLPGLRDEASLLGELVDTAVNRHVAVRVLSRGTRLQLGGAIVHCLHPARRPRARFNDNSLVLHIASTTTSLLLPGDLEAAGEHELLLAGLLTPVTILKVAHHGSITSSGTAFLAAVRPAQAVISVGQGNPFGHPDPRW